MQQAAINRLTKAYARGNFEEYRSVQHTALAFYLALAIGGTCLAAAVFPVAPASQWIGLKLTSASPSSLAPVLLAASFVGSVPTGAIGATYQTPGDFRRSQRFGNAHPIPV